MQLDTAYPLVKRHYGPTGTMYRSPSGETARRESFGQPTVLHPSLTDRDHRAHSDQYTYQIRCDCGSNIKKAPEDEDDNDCCDHTMETDANTHFL